MDGSRFDLLAKSLAAGRTRRGVLGALAGAIAASLGLGTAEARVCRSVGNSCAANGDCCSANCVTESRTRKICHCSSPSDCPAGDQCRAPVCTDSGCGLQVTTGASCDDGNACTVNDQCQQNGTCAGTPVVCTEPNECFTAGTCQGGTCSNPVYHGDQTACSGGVCFQQACCAPVPNETTCAGACGPQTNNCGQSVTCPPCCFPAGGGCQANSDCCSAICAAGTCVGGPVADGGACDEDGDCLNHHCCSGVCRDLNTDPDHCGACATVCSSNNMATRTCGGGVCNGTCATGYGDCNGNKQTDGCETHISDGDPNNCGGCGVVCPSGPHAIAVCNASACGGTCANGYSDCNNDLSDGCETSIDGDFTNCGACGFECSGAHGIAICTQGVCTPSCDPGWGDCDTTVNDGCETNLLQSSDHCGACGVECALNETCVNGVCMCGSNPACAGGTHCVAEACVANCPGETCGETCLCIGGPNGDSCAITGGQGCVACVRDTDCPSGSVCGYSYFLANGGLNGSPFDNRCQHGARGYCVDILRACTPT